MPSGGDRAGKVAFADTYHGKVLRLESARELISVREEVSLTGLERVIPYAKARDIILTNPDHIVALECPCRASRANPCLPLDVCLIVGEPFAAFVLEHHPKRARRIDSEEAADILQAEHDRGHVHHAFFKDAMLGRYYAICNCCACCCGAMAAHRDGTPMLASSGYLCHVDLSLCASCGICDGVCPFGALTCDGSAAEVSSESCMGCGVCVDRCPEGALSLRRAHEKGEPLEIQNLIEQFAGIST
jgi:ferredoxin